VLRAVRNDRLAKAKTDLPELLFFFFGKLRVTRCQEIDSLRHPLDLIFFVSANYVTLADRAEELVASSVVQRLRLFRLGPRITSLSRQHNLLRFQSWANNERSDCSRMTRRE
jgi:hypothetical protein